jgi:hypothetical protein
MTERAWTVVLTFAILCGLQRQAMEPQVIVTCITTPAGVQVQVLDA